MGQVYHSNPIFRPESYFPENIHVSRKIAIKDKCISGLKEPVHSILMHPELGSNVTKNELNASIAVPNKNILKNIVHPNYIP